jgi:hypothetical protein
MVTVHIGPCSEEQVKIDFTCEYSYTTQELGMNVQMVLNQLIVVVRMVVNQLKNHKQFHMMMENMYLKIKM